MAALPAGAPPCPPSPGLLGQRSVSCCFWFQVNTNGSDHATNIDAGACSKRGLHRGLLPRLAAADAGRSGDAAAAAQVLDARQRSKIDLSDDRLFYSAPRFVHHLDARFRAQLTQLYRERIPEGADILDLCR